MAAENVISIVKLPNNSEYYLKDSDAARQNHSHTTTIIEALSTDTSQLELVPNTVYKLSAGGTNYIFTTPPDNDTKIEIIDLTT